MSFSRFLAKTRGSVVEAFFDAPAGKRLIAQAERDHQKEVDAQRAAWGALLEAEQKRHEAAIAGLRKDEVAALAVYKKAKSSCDAAAAKLRIARRRRFNEEMAYTSRHAALATALRKLVHPAVLDAQATLDSAYQKTRNDVVAIPAVRAKLMAISEGRRALDRLRDDATVDQAAAAAAILSQCT